MHIREKTHEYLLSLLAVQQGVAVRAGLTADSVLLKAGNCIPLALAHVTGRYDAIVERISAASPENATADSRGMRTYRECQTMCKVIHQMNIHGCGRSIA